MIDGPPDGADSTELVNNSSLYREFLAERREILCHKWIESEKAGYDIGFERALINWVVKYRSTWRENDSFAWAHRRILHLTSEIPQQERNESQRLPHDDLACEGGEMKRGFA
jgi:hypothetical protein